MDSKEENLFLSDPCMLLAEGAAMCFGKSSGLSSPGSSANTGTATTTIKPYVA